MINARKTSIVFVDDDLCHLNGLRQLECSNLDCRMHFTDNLVDVLELLNNGHVDVIVSDARMPHIDGIELLKFVATYHPTVARIVLSAQMESRYALNTSTSHAIRKNYWKTYYQFENGNPKFVIEIGFNIWPT